MHVYRREARVGIKERGSCRDNGVRVVLGWLSVVRAGGTLRAYALIPCSVRMKVAMHRVPCSLRQPL